MFDTFIMVLHDSREFRAFSAMTGVLVAQMKRMTTKLRLSSRFNAASLATNLTTTTMYNTISNGTILNLVRSIHDQVARVYNYSKPAISKPHSLSNKPLINQGWVGGGVAS